MLNFIFGRSGCGKTEYVFKNIENLVNSGEKDILLITPEQYSFVAERRLLTDLGEAKISAVENTSFSRISNEVKRQHGADKLPVLSNGAKAVMMMQAIEKVKDKLTLFNRGLDSVSFVNSMISVYDEMRSCNLSVPEIQQRTSGITNDILFRKMNDITLIINAYENLIDNRFLDSSNELTRLYDKIKDLGYFKNRTVFFDGFNGFVAQEYKILEVIIKEAKNVIITLCSDSYTSDDPFNLFAYVNNSYKIIRKIAEKAGIPVKVTELRTNYRAKSKNLEHFEKSVLSDNITRGINSDNTISIYSAKNISDECNEISRQIKKLLRQGYRASEIAVITRDLEKYRDELSYSFKKYEIPFFNDERQPIKSQPIIVFIEYLLRSVIFSFRSDDILSLAKTGLTELSDEEINALENYIYLWNISGSKWTKPFTNSTKGFVNEITKQDKNNLDGINLSREKLIKPILIFKKTVKSADVTEICAAIYNALIAFKADKQLKNIAISLNSNGCNVLAAEQGRVWDMLMEILNQLSVSIGNEKISLKDFSRLFSLVISTEDLGTLPSGIDNVQIGQADRIRTDNPKAVFILGANEGEFPRTVTGGGILTENERRILLENDFKLYSYSDILNVQEKYFAYMACTAPSDKLMITYLGNTGRESSPSEIITSLKSSVSNVNEYNFNDISDIDLIESNSSAFELMSERFLKNDTFYSSLKEYFKDNDRFLAVKSLAENVDYSIESKKTATNLFGYNMLISASRIEDYFNCPFRYFCKFGLSAKPRKRAELDPMQRGTLIHHVLEMFLSEHGCKALSKMNSQEIISLVDKYIADYFIEEMGDVSDISIRFKYNYKRLSNLIYSVVFHLAKEFENCEFEAKAFELGIDNDGEVKPEIIALDDGGTIQIRGSIDRVDTFEINGKQFVRVVDYKSGVKKFNLSDIMHGLNLQMFVYLFSLCSDKNAKLSGTPAGVLYMHAARNMFNFDSSKIAVQNIKSDEDKSFKMNGIVLGDYEEVVRAMEADLSGKYIPVSLKKSGELKGDIASLEELGAIHKKINSLIAQMGLELHNGNIKQSPIKCKGHKNTCDFCDYSDICAQRKFIEIREETDYSDSEVKEILSKEFKDNG